MKEFRVAMRGHLNEFQVAMRGHHERVSGGHERTS